MGRWDNYRCYTEIKNRLKHIVMYKCIVCGYIYDPEQGDPAGGIEPGTQFIDLPDDYLCPICGASKDEFVNY